MQLGFQSTAFDEGTKANSLCFDSSVTQPLLLEVKQFRNLSRPYQRVTKNDTGEKIAVTSTSGVKRDHTFNLIAHDGVRFIKLVLLMPNQAAIVKDLHSKNKFVLRSGYVDSSSDRGNIVILVDGQDQLSQVFADKQSEKLQETSMPIQGLPIKYTNAPKFQFLSENAKTSGERRQKEQEDEFADLYKAMGVHDLNGKELIYIKKLEQMGFWRKKFGGEAE